MHLNGKQIVNKKAFFLTFALCYGIMNKTIRKERYFTMDDGDSTDTTCMCNVTVVRGFHYIS